MAWYCTGRAPWSYPPPPPASSLPSAFHSAPRRLSITALRFTIAAHGRPSAGRRRSTVAWCCPSGRTRSVASKGPVDVVFLGADFAQPASRHVVSLGAMRGVQCAIHVVLRV